MKYFVYMLLCKDKTFYTGVTNDILRRVAEHKSAMHPESYTAKRLPVELVYQCSFNDSKLAIAFEKRLKSWSKSKKIALIESEFEKLPLLAKKKFKK